MTYSSFANLVKVSTATVGVGAITLGSALTGFRGAAGLVDGETYSYHIQDGAAYEDGQGIYSSSGDTLTRAIIDDSSNSGAAIALSGSAWVIVGTMLARDAADMVDRITLLEQGQNENAVVAISWASLSGLPSSGRLAGTPGKSYEAPGGTHTDPVTGVTTTPNRGIFAWSTSPVGWTYVGTLESDDAAGYAQDAADSAAAALTAVAPTARLPAKVKHFYPLNEGAGTVLKDLIGGLDADLTTGSGYSWTIGGWLKLTNGWFKLPSMAHRCIIVVLRAPDGMVTGYYFCNKDGLAVGPNYGNYSGIPTFKMLSGWGIHNLTRRSDPGGSGCLELQCGGWIMPAPIFPTAVTGNPIIGAANQAGAGPVGSCEYAGIYVLDDAPTDSELRRILDFERERQKPRGIILSYRDGAEKRVLIQRDGESTDEGTFYASITGTVSSTTLTVNSVSGGSTLLPDHEFHNGALAGIRVVKQLSGTTGGAGTYQLSAAATVAVAAVFYFSGLGISAQNGFSQTTFISANNGGNATTYVAPARLTARPGYQNNVPPSKLVFTPTSGWEMGFKEARNERPDDGRQTDLLANGVGSTFLLPGGSDPSTASTDYTNATGGTTSVGSSQSRNVGTIPGSGLFSSVHGRSRYRREQQGRNAGIGYSTVVFVTNEGLNDAFLGAAAVTSKAMYLAMLEAKRAFLIADTGIANVLQVIVKPHHPTGPANVLGVDPDYPNNSAGVSRQTALGYIRDAIDDFAAAHPGLVAVLDGDNYTLNGAANDLVHPDALGYDTMGRAIDALLRTSGFYNTLVQEAA